MSNEATRLASMITTKTVSTRKLMVAVAGGVVGLPNTLLLSPGHGFTVRVTLTARERVKRD